jgi:hypothetical protein
LLGKKNQFIFMELGEGLLGSLLDDDDLDRESEEVAF